MLHPYGHFYQNSLHVCIEQGYGILGGHLSSCLGSMRAPANTMMFGCKSRLVGTNRVKTFKTCFNQKLKYF